MQAKSEKKFKIRKKVVTTKFAFSFAVVTKRARGADNMAFRAIVVNEHSKLSYKNNHLVYKSAKDVQTIHLSEIELLILETTDIAITSMLISKLTEENIAVIFCDNKRLPAAQLIPYYGRHDSSLQIQNQIIWSEDSKALAWKAVLGQKIGNQSKLLQRYGFEEKAESIMKLFFELEVKDSSNREGHAARIMFNTLYGNDFSRERDNDINAALNYGYTLLMSVFSREIVKCGCLTQLGINHTNQFNSFNLASDLMEPFRLIVDEIVYDHHAEPFPIIKRKLLAIFTRTYLYRKSDMYLMNIAAHYTKNVIDYLNGVRHEMPEFIKG